MESGPDPVASTEVIEGLHRLGSGLFDEAYVLFGKGRAQSGIRLHKTRFALAKNDNLRGIGYKILNIIQRADMSLSAPPVRYHPALRYFKVMVIPSAINQHFSETI